MLSASSKFQVRPGHRSDAERLTQVFQLAWRQTYTGMVPKQHLDNMIQARGLPWWRRTLRSRDTVLTAEYDDEIIGYATCGAARYKGPLQGEIYELYLLPDFQGVGFGEFLFEACRYQLDQQSRRGLIVWALAANYSAAQFYWRRGGRPVATSYELMAGERIEKTGFGWRD